MMDQTAFFFEASQKEDSSRSAATQCVGGTLENTGSLCVPVLRTQSIMGKNGAMLYRISQWAAMGGITLQYFKEVLL
jgi:hypothetical protein